MNNSNSVQYTYVENSKTSFRCISKDVSKGTKHVPK